MPRGKTGGGNHAVKGADWEERVLNSKLSSSIDVVIFFPRTIVDKRH